MIENNQQHFLLFCDSSLTPSRMPGMTSRGHWCFTLETLVNGEVLEASDCETTEDPDRIALMAVVRGLEAIPEPASVNLVTTSRYVFRGIQYGLSEWREQGYCWEHFGILRPIRNADLWRRIDRTLKFHSIRSRLIEATSKPTEFGDEQRDPAASASAKSVSELEGSTGGVGLADAGVALESAMVASQSKRSKLLPRFRLGHVLDRQNGDRERLVPRFEILGAHVPTWKAVISLARLPFGMVTLLGCGLVQLLSNFGYSIRFLAEELVGFGSKAHSI